MDDSTATAIDAIKREAGKEPYARKVGMELIALRPGYALLEMAFGEDTGNIFGKPHGGAIFSLIDEAFEVSSNSHGTMAVALNCSVSYLKAPEIGDVLRAESREVSRSKRIGTYFIEVRNTEGELIATCSAMAYRKAEGLPFLPR